MKRASLLEEIQEADNYLPANLDLHKKENGGAAIAVPPQTNN